MGEANRGKGLAELLDGFGAHAVQLAEVCLADFGESVQGRVSGRGEGSLCWLGESCGKVSLLGLMVLGLRCRRPTHAEIRAQRARIGELLGQLRDTQREHDSDAAGWLTAENSTLKQRLRDLTASNRTLEERLQAARSNNRFLDKRIAGLEAQLLNAETDT